MEENDPIEKMIKGIIDNYSNELTINPENKKELKKIDSTSTTDISEIVLKKVDSNDAVAKEIYDLFYGGLALGKDHSESSKEALLRSLELKVESSKTLVELIKALNKKEQNSNGNVGVFVNTKSGEDFGINIKNIQDNIDSK